MLNHIVIAGRLVRDPELRRTGSGIAVARFTVAVDRDFKAQDGSRETDFFDCVAWRQTGEFVSKFFSKGRMIIVSGKLQNRDWTDKDGNKRRSAEIVTDNCYFGESKKDSECGSNANAGGYGSSQYQETEDMLRQYGTAAQYPGNDYGYIEEPDGQLPF